MNLYSNLTTGDFSKSPFGLGWVGEGGGAKLVIPVYHICIPYLYTIFLYFKTSHGHIDLHNYEIKTIILLCNLFIIEVVYLLVEVKSMLQVQLASD